MAGKVAPIPEGFQSITPSLVVKDGNAAIDLYKKAFGAEEVMRMRSPSGGLMHGEIRIGNSVVMLSDEWPDHGMKAPVRGHNSGGLHLYVADADKAYQRALDAGCQSIMPPSDMFWGDRYGKVLDPFGHEWAFASRYAKLSAKQMEAAAAAAFAQPPA